MFIFVKSFVWTLIYSVFFFLFYNQVYRPLGKYPSDLNQHIGFIDHINLIAHPLWHYIVRIIADLFQISFQHAAILFTPLLVVSIFIIINKILEFTLKNESRTTTTKQYTLLFFSLALLISSAIYLPFFNKYIYLGQSACGVWHNVTLLMVKPLAFLSMFFTVLYIQTKEIKYFTLGILLTTTSIFAKPNFIIMFLPSLYLFILYYIYKQKDTPLKKSYNIKTIFDTYRYVFIYLFIITLISIGILISQFLTAFGENNPGNSKVIFDFLGVWSLYTPNIIVSILLTFMFPFFVFIFINHKKSDMYVLSIIMLVVSMVIYSCFAESGSRYDHGNFAWTVHIAYHIFFVFSIVEFLKGYDTFSYWKKYLLSITLSLHIISGLFYLGKILNGGVFF